MSEVFNTPIYTIPPDIKDEEIANILRRVASGESKPQLINPSHSWGETYAGNVGFLVEGWKIVVFNDCDSWDYIDSVVSPDGRTWDYSQWYQTHPNYNTDLPVTPPEGFLSSNEFERMVGAFEAAK
jgi:hypothetical protein